MRRSKGPVAGGRVPGAPLDGGGALLQTSGGAGPRCSRSEGRGGGGGGLCLKGRGAIGEIPERLQSGHRGCKAVGGRLLAVGNPVGAGVGVWEWLWGRVRAGVLGGRGVPPPPPLQAIPWGGGTGPESVGVQRHMRALEQACP